MPVGDTITNIPPIHMQRWAKRYLDTDVTRVLLHYYPGVYPERDLTLELHGSKIWEPLQLIGKAEDLILALRIIAQQAEEYVQQRRNQDTPPAVPDAQQ